MSVELDPPELGFRRPFTQEVSQILRLKNIHGEPVAFKVKTTAPKQYCVRPNSGVIEPQSHVEIQVLLQAMKQDPPLDARCRDKFLVQSAPLGSASGANVTAIWPEIEKTAKDTIKERKIRVTFLPAHDGAAAHGVAVNGVSGTPEDSVLSEQRSPSPKFGSAAATPARGVTNGEAGGIAAAGAGATATVAAAAAVTKDNLQQQLDAAKATIAQLKAQAEEGLRKRNIVGGEKSVTEKGSGATAMAVQTQGAAGVPVPIVAALCLLSFLIGFFVF